MFDWCKSYRELRCIIILEKDRGDWGRGYVYNNIIMVHMHMLILAWLYTPLVLVVGVLVDTLGLAVNSGLLIWIFYTEMDQKKVLAKTFATIT